MGAITLDDCEFASTDNRDEADRIIRADAARRGIKIRVVNTSYNGIRYFDNHSAPGKRNLRYRWYQ